MCILDFQQCGNHTALPVVTMDYIRLEVKKRKHVQGSAAEEPEPLILISAHSVNIRTVKVVFIIHKIPCHTVQLKLFDPAILPAPSKLDFEIACMGHLAVVFTGNLAEIREKDPDIVPFFRKNGSQRADHIGKSACFYKRNSLTGNKQNFQCIPS